MFSSMEEEEEVKTTTTTTTLPQDIISLIITFLPPKPLTRFKLISKSFLCLINHPHFILLYFQRSTSTSTSTSRSSLSLASISHDSSPLTLHTLHLPTLQITKLPLPFTSKFTPPDLIASSYGILCVAAFPHFLALINPLNRTFKDIPFHNPKHQDGYVGESHWVDFGFGFDQVHKDFKVLRIDQLHNLGGQREVSIFSVRENLVDQGLVGPREVHVFSLRDNSWKKVDDFPYFLSHPMSHGKFLCNSLHWIATTTNPVVFNITGILWRGRLDDFVYDYVLVAFDLSSDKFRVLELPDYGVGDLVVPRLSVGVFGECLFLQVEHGMRFKRCVDIWVMKEYGVKESWIKLLSFPYMEVRSELLPIRTLALSNKGDEVLMQLGKECFWVEVESGNTRDVVIDGGFPFLAELVSGHRCGFGAVPFVESLVCLGSRVDEEVGGVENKGKGRKKRDDLLSSGFRLK